MMIYLSSLLKKYKGSIQYNIIKEKEFDVFSRITSNNGLTKCSFISNKSYLQYLDNNVSMIIVNSKILPEYLNYDGGFCITDKPKELYFGLLNIWNKELNESTKKKSVINNSAIIENGSYIASSNVIIGANTVVEDGARILEGSVIGDNVVIHSGAIIASQDFNYYYDENGILRHSLHVGKVYIKDHVEIGYNSIVGRPLYDYNKTIIGKNSVIGFNTLIGHDALIGERCQIYSNVAIGGHTFLGDNCIIGLGADIKNGLHIGDNVKIDMGSVVIRDILDGQTVFGNPAKRVIVPK